MVFKATPLILMKLNGEVCMRSMH